jgi:ABC-2 type transport system permease protein
MDTTTAKTTANTAVLSTAQRIGIYVTEARYQFLLVARVPAFVFPTLAFPLMFYVFFGVILGTRGFSLAAPTYLLVTYGVFGIIGPALFGFGVGIANERDEGSLLLKRTTPMPASAYLFAKIMMAVLFAAGVVVGLFTLAALAGGVTLFREQWFQLAALLIGGTLPFCALGLAIGTWTSSQAAIAIVNLTYLPMAFFSGLWFPVSAFPEAMQTFALSFPPYHLAQIALKVIDMDQGQPIAMHIGVLAAYTAAFMVLATIGFRRVSQR